MQTDNRIVNRPLYTEAAPTYHGSLRKCQVQLPVATCSIESYDD
jgi:hypothetical protein